MIRFGQTAQVQATTRMLTSLKDRVDRQTRVAVSQLEVQTPSDAAGQWTRIHRFEDLLRDQAVYVKNARTAQSALDVAESAVAEASHLLVEARELTVQLSSGTFNDADRQNAAVRVRAIRDTLIGLANTEFAGRSVFAGTAYDVPAYDRNGTYLGNAEEAAIVVGDGQTVRGSLVGSDVFGDALLAVGDLADALDLGDADAVAARLDSLDDARLTLVRTRQEIGFDQLDATDASDLATSLELRFQQSLNDEVAADPVESYTELSQLQQAYQVALQVTASVSSTSLFNFLR